MRQFLQQIFDSAGKGPVGRLVAGMAVGALVTAFALVKDGSPPIGSAVGWVCSGAGTGMLAVGLLQWPRAFSGTVLALLGLLVVLVPFTRLDGIPVPLEYQVVKVLIGLLIGSVGFLLIYWARRRRLREAVELAEARKRWSE